MSFVGIAVGFSWLGVYTPDKWVAGSALYILGRELQLLLLPCSSSKFATATSGLIPNMLDILGRGVSLVHILPAPSN